MFKIDNLIDITPVCSSKGMKKPNLSNEARNAVVQFLLQHRKDDGKLKKGCLTDAATHFKVSTKTVTRIWDRYIGTANDRGVGGDVSSRKGNCGRKKRHIDKLNDIANIPLNQRGNLRSLSCAINVPMTTLH